MGTFDFLQDFQVEFLVGQMRVLLAQTAANQSDQHFAGIQHGLPALRNSSSYLPLIMELLVLSS